MPTAIEFDNISKEYRLGLVSTRTLSHDLNRWWKTKILRKDDPYLKIGEVNDRAHKGESDYVWALKDINLKVEQGEVLGIIGKNGAGKSTLLKILSRVTSPTTGTIRARGRIASLLEVGTGFHPEMTGRENIYMNGAILGMTKKEIDRKLDEIVDFSGVERYIDTPVKRYSSGMTVRLGFAIAAHLEPEILVVDEVLAVGDAEFQKKAIGKMQDVSKGDGRTVLFVSHNMGAVKSLCQRGILLDDGYVSDDNDIDSIVTKYINFNHPIEIYETQKDNSVYLKSANTVDLEGNQKANFDLNEEINLKLEVVIKSDLPIDTVIGVVILDENKNKISTIEYPIGKRRDEKKSANLLLKLPKGILMPGYYSFHIAIHHPNVTIYDLVDDICQFQIIEDNSLGLFKYSGIKQGAIILKAKWEKI
jgi:lipopolysaccharide transport system ATP-binding protein